MDKYLTGKTALVTGAGRRIGREIALALAGAGANIVIHYPYSSDEAGDLEAELAKRSVKSWLVKADFEETEDYGTLLDRTIESSGSLDILINSASVFSPGKLGDIRYEDLMRNMQINAWAPFVLMRDFARLSGRGKIINLLDTRIAGYDMAHVAYILSKHVLMVLTKMAALEYAPHIAINGIAPGLILPPPGQDDHYLDRLSQTVPLKRRGYPADISRAVLYLLSNDFITGEVLYIDGGRHLMEYGHGSHTDI
jgi:pteridine reductase